MRRPKKDRSGLVEVTDLLEGALEQLGASGDVSLFRLERKVRDLAGERMSQAIVRVRLKNGKAILEFRHPIWLNEMNFLKAAWLQKLQKELPEAGVKSLDAVLAKSGPEPKE